MKEITARYNILVEPSVVYNVSIEDFIQYLNDIDATRIYYNDKKLICYRMNGFEDFVDGVFHVIEYITQAYITEVEGYNRFLIINNNEGTYEFTDNPNNLSFGEQQTVIPIAIYKYPTPHIDAILTAI